MSKRILPGAQSPIPAIAVVLGMLLVAFFVLKWITDLIENLEPTIVAALIVGGLTVLSSVTVASINARRAQERVAREANISRKAEVYEGFMDFLVANMKSEGDAKGQLFDRHQDFFYKFASKVTIYGGPKVVKAFLDWREIGANSDEKSLDHLQYFERFVREMREDLGESNKGIVENGFLGIFVVGGAAGIAEELRKKSELQAPNGETP